MQGMARACPCIPDNPLKVATSHAIEIAWQFINLAGWLARFWKAEGLQANLRDVRLA